MAAKDLSELLGGAQHQGAYDSTSEFTVDSESAASKLGRHQLPSPEYWLAKIVQGANEAGASHIDIKLKRAAIEVRIEGEQLPSPESLEEALATWHSTTAHFVIALRAITQESGASFEFGPSSSTRLVLIVKRKRKFGRLTSTPGRTLLAARTEEYHLLLSRCWVSPVPITIDSRPLGTRFGHPSSAGDPAGRMFSRSVLPISFVGAPLPALEGRPELKIAQPSLEGCEQVRDEAPWQIHIREEYHAAEQFMVGRLKDGSPFGAHINFGHGMLGFAVHFICDGVIVDTVLLDHSVPRFDMHHPFGSFQLYAPVESSELDLSGFHLRDREELAHRYLKSVLEQAFHLSETFSAYDGRFKLPFNQTKEGRKVKECAMSLISAAPAGILMSGVFLSVLPAVLGSVPFAVAGGMANKALRNHQNRMISWAKPLPVPLKESLHHWQLLLEQQGVGGWSPRTLPRVSTELQGWQSWSQRAFLRSGLWAVKLVQAGVAAQAERISLSFSADSFRFKWMGGQRLHPDELLDVLSGSSEPTGTLLHLAEALFALSNLPIESINLDLSEGNLLWTPTELDTNVSDDISADLTLILTLAKPSKGSFLQGLRSKTRAYKQLVADALGRVREHCWVSPVPVILDGRPLDSRFADVPRGRRMAFQGLDHRRFPACLAHRELARLSGRPMLARPFQKPLDPTPPQQVDLPGTYLRFPTQPELGGLLLVTGWLRSDSAVEFVHDGALVDLQALYHPQDMVTATGRNPFDGILQGYPRAALRLIVAVSSDDLSASFQVTQPATLAKAILKELEPALVETCAHLEEALPEFKYRQSSRAKKRDTVSTGILNQHNRKYGVLSALSLRKALAKGVKELPELIHCLDPKPESEACPS